MPLILRECFPTLPWPVSETARFTTMCTLVIVKCVKPTISTLVCIVICCNTCPSFFPMLLSFDESGLHLVSVTPSLVLLPIQLESPSSVCTSKNRQTKQEEPDISCVKPRLSVSLLTLSLSVSLLKQTKTFYSVIQILTVNRNSQCVTVHR